jgi:hypothetical protein
MAHRDYLTAAAVISRRCAGGLVAAAGPMLLRTACFLALAVGCGNQGEDKILFDDRAEAGSTWQLDFGRGELVDGSPFAGPCPTLAPQTIQVPNSGQPCDRGCTCVFGISVSDIDNDVLGGEDEELSIQLVHNCDPGPDYFSYDDIAPTGSNDVTVLWDATPRTLDNIDQSDCTYPLHLGVTFATGSS